MVRFKMGNLDLLINGGNLSELN